MFQMKKPLQWFSLTKIEKKFYKDCIKKIYIFVLYVWPLSYFTVFRITYIQTLSIQCYFTVCICWLTLPHVILHWLTFSFRSLQSATICFIFINFLWSKNLRNDFMLLLNFLQLVFCFVLGAISIDYFSPIHEKVKKKYSILECVFKNHSHFKFNLRILYKICKNDSY